MHKKCSICLQDYRIRVRVQWLVNHSTNTFSSRTKLMLFLIRSTSQPISSRNWKKIMISTFFRTTCTLSSTTRKRQKPRKTRISTTSKVIHKNQKNLWTRTLKFILMKKFILIKILGLSSMMVLTISNLTRNWTYKTSTNSLKWMIKLNYCLNRYKMILQTIIS